MDGLGRRSDWIGVTTALSEQTHTPWSPLAGFDEPAGKPDESAA